MLENTNAYHFYRMFSAEAHKKREKKNKALLTFTSMAETVTELAAAEITDINKSQSCLQVVEISDTTDTQSPIIV